VLEHELQSFAKGARLSGRNIRAGAQLPDNAVCAFTDHVEDLVAGARDEGRHSLVHGGGNGGGDGDNDDDEQETLTLC
jgi:hypothetical protein